jgi:hypothetical protein
MLFVFEFCVCLHFVNINNDLFTFSKFLKTGKMASIWVSNERPREKESLFFDFRVCLHFVNLNKDLFTF